MEKPPFIPGVQGGAACAVHLSRCLELRCGAVAWIAALLHAWFHCRLERSRLQHPQRKDTQHVAFRYWSFFAVGACLWAAHFPGASSGKLQHTMTDLLGRGGLLLAQLWCCVEAMCRATLNFFLRLQRRAMWHCFARQACLAVDRRRPQLVSATCGIHARDVARKPLAGVVVVRLLPGRAPCPALFETLGLRTCTIAKCQMSQ